MSTGSLQKSMHVRTVACFADSVGVIKLVDVQDNQFVLSKGKDSTVPHEDHHLIEVNVIE